MGSDHPFEEPFYGGKINEIIEKCVICKVDTPYKKSTHIDMRKNYIEGVGQLCYGCYLIIYK